MLDFFLTTVDKKKDSNINKPKPTQPTRVRHAMQLATLFTQCPSNWDNCIFCGAVTCENGESVEGGKRTKTKAEVADFVRSWCKPTPFLYQALSNLSGKEKMDICIPCVNWYRRCSQGMKKRNGGGNQLLRVDHLILYMIEPGKVLKPDQRCLWRLMKTLKSAEKQGKTLAWYEVVPLPVQTMLSRVSSDKILDYVPFVDKDVPELLKRSMKDGKVVFDELIRVWWEYNGRPKFFSHQETAKLVRKYVKDYEDPVSSSSGSGAAFGEPGFDDDGEDGVDALIAELEAAIGEKRTDCCGDGANEAEFFPESASATQSEANEFCEVNVSRSLEI